MKASYKKAWNWITAIVMLLASIAIAGLFVSETTTTFPILEYLPAEVHVWFGWLVIIGSAITFIMKVYKAVK